MAAQPVPSALVYTCTRAEGVCIAARAGARVCHSDHGCAFTASERARPACACARRRIHSTCMHTMRSCSRGHILHRTIPRGIPYDDDAWIPSPVGWGDLVDRGFLRRAAKDRRLLLHVLRARLELARLLPCRVGYHVVWDTIPCLPWHAASHAMRDTVPRESPCRVGYRVM